jgi:glycosyltransferase involved in cell wall biosynthesis
LKAKTESIITVVLRYWGQGKTRQSLNTIVTQRWSIGIVNFPLVEAGIKPLSHILDILSPLSINLNLIAGDAAVTLRREYKKVDFHLVNHRTGKNALTRVTNYVLTQLRIALKLASLSSKVDLWFFFPGGEGGLLLPTLAAKLVRSRVILCLGSSDIEFGKARKDPLFVLLARASRINLALCDRIILYSENLIGEWELDKYIDKISIAHRHFVDFDKFKILKPLKKRNDLVGYIGRLSQEKGILSFIEAIPKLCQATQDVKFLIGGDGPLRSQVEEYLAAANLSGRVEFIGWIPNHELPEYLNELKLLVLPSYSEALPNIMLEAMACGTPVLATPVGAIPDVITDGETGFIMEENSPECVAKNVIRALDYLELGRIVEDARVLVETEYDYQASLGGYEKILASLQ